MALRDAITKAAADKLYPLADDIEAPLSELTDNLAELQSDGETDDREDSTTFARESLIALVDAVANLVREAKKAGLIDFELIDSRSRRAESK